MIRGEQEVRYGTNCLLGKECHLLQNLSVQDTCHNTYHYLVLCCLHGSAETEHYSYLGRRRFFPLVLLRAFGEEYRLFVDIHGEIHNPPWR